MFICLDAAAAIYNIAARPAMRMGKSTVLVKLATIAAFNVSQDICRRHWT